MFFWKQHKQDLEFLKMRVDLQASIIEKMDEDIKKMSVTIGNILISQQHLREAAHGLKKDGTPRAKPGRPFKNKSEVQQ
jgi:hypothetical protein